MEKSILYDVLQREIFSEWKDTVEAEDGCGFAAEAKKLKEELQAELNDKNKKLLSHYGLAIENFLEYVYYNLNIKILNLGIKIGMQLQDSFFEREE